MSSSSWGRYAPDEDLELVISADARPLGTSPPPTPRPSVPGNGPIRVRGTYALVTMRLEGAARPPGSRIAFQGIYSADSGARLIKPPQPPSPSLVSSRYPAFQILHVVRTSSLVIILELERPVSALTSLLSPACCSRVRPPPCAVSFRARLRVVSVGDEATAPLVARRLALRSPRPVCLRRAAGRCLFRHVQPPRARFGPGTGVSPTLSSVDGSFSPGTLLLARLRGSGRA
jgi:hypothetical protein